MTTIADVIVPEEFAPYMLKRTAETAPLLNSMAVRTDPDFVSFLAGGGTTVNVPFWQPLNQTDSEVSDDSDDDSVPEKVTAQADIAIRHNRNKTWTAMDLTSQLAGSDAVEAIIQLQNDYWNLNMQSIMVASLRGVQLDNVANNSGDMVHDISNDLADAVTDAELISAEAIIDAMQTMGDTQQDLAAIAMHSVVMSRLNKLNLIDFIPDWRGEINMPTYLGKPIIINDQLTPIAGTNRMAYTTYLLGHGCIATAEAPARVPVEPYRNPLKGNGGGNETLTIRRQFIYHPAGIKFTSASLAKPSPSTAELQDPANWSRVYPERKMVKMAFLITNG